ncbi:hypothetical protein TREMEDRAFT_73909 [Tremella mesenterica DSM 1558]|uniref:uncharacterized protein n=1 Tax=Tremella mesenterica (strain ATCC 24925 / CBS 8224 / DSM 1558 / NBRC 9311 / NRRL Y-6157 / RJB 2259-6 / UBC 559-6) TaxID=578456 RepID=UPI0003F4967C|nr:uncharacterized protein TREMEDRAFT_73909 [Tremella mesenterica DSM 1558]EIW69578.1 hypothetical protein TREMEDRAFT_73909 [Tremella mesenterica DSM 1558]
MSTKTRGIKRPGPSSNDRAKFKSARFNKPSRAQKPSIKSEKSPEHAAPQRKRPITQQGMGDEPDEEDVESDGMDVDSLDEKPDELTKDEPPAEKKVRMTKAERAALHAAQPHRTTLLPSYPLLQDTLLPLWEKARRSDLAKEERKTTIAELWTAAQGRVGEIFRSHKGARILQTIVKHGGKDERLGVAMELQPQWRAMMESKYSKFLIGKLIRFCPTIRPLLIQAISPDLLRLLSHAEAVQPLADLYDLYATGKERKLLIRGFYPKEVIIFDDSKDEIKGLEEVLSTMGEGTGKERVLDAVGKTVVDVFNSTQKKALTQQIFHRLVLEYLTCIYRFLETEIAETKMHELLSAALESLPEIIHTKDGSSVVRFLIVRGHAKERKQTLQQLRKHTEAICKDAEAQLVLFTAFDCVDDTKLMGKTFISDITTLSHTLAFDKTGRRAMLYLLAPTSTRHNIPAVLQSLQVSATQATEFATSKKDPILRREEIRAYASEGLLKAVEEKGPEMVRDPGAGLVVQEIMLSTMGDKSQAIKALIKPICGPYTVSTGYHILDLPHASRTYKTMLSGGHFNSKLSAVEVVDQKLRSDFSQAFWQAITSSEAGGETNVVELAKGSPFIVLEMIGGLEDAGRLQDVKSVLGSKDVRQAIEAEGQKGATLLVEKLAIL